MRDKTQLQPHQVVVDLVVQHSATMPRVGQAAVLGGNLFITAHNHRGQAVALSMPVSFDGEPFDGDVGVPPRFVLVKLGATVWKLAPSVLHPLLHAYVTIVGVPEDISWGK